MWAGHFEELGAPSENIQFDNDFDTPVTPCTDDPSGALSGPLSSLKRLHQFAHSWNRGGVVF